MRVLMVIAEMGSGGAEAMVAALSADLQAQGDTVIVASSGGRRVADLRRAGVEHLPVRLRGRRPDALLAAAATIAGELRRRRVDVVHAHNVKATVAASWGIRLSRRRRPLVTTVHGLDAPDYARAARLLRAHAGAVVAVSADTAGRLRRAGLDAPGVQVVPNGIPQLTRHDRATARRRLGLPDGAPVVLCAARLAAPKRQDLLVDALAWLPAETIVLLAGDGPHRTRLAARIAAAGRPDRVRLLGDRSDLDWLLAAADVLALPSDREGLPMVVLEAIGAGTPVVASDVGGIRELGAGAVQLVRPGSGAALADGLLRVLGDERVRAAMAERGRVLGEQWAWPVVGDAYRALYRQLLGLPRRPDAVVPS